ncbi:MAG: hypothetical protein U9R39_06500 [Campylobacterota bacterium]|nr:hypothetical protein [Campylobacterota bacterium]
MKKKEKYIDLLNKFNEKIKKVEKKTDTEAKEELRIMKQLRKNLIRKIG